MLNKISYFLIVGVILFGSLVIYYLSDESQVFEVNPYNQFTVCHPVEDFEKSTHELEGHITWTKDYCLKWDDFEGKPNYEINKVAWTTWWIQTYSKVNVIDETTREYQFSDIEVVAFFDKTKSWVILEQLGSRELEVLRHEQGHFDLAEEHSREIENNMKKLLIGNIYIYNGVSKNPSFDAKLSADKLTQKIFDDFWDDDIDEKYDLATGNSTKWNEQIDYNLRFDKLRNES